MALLDEVLLAAVNGAGRKMCRTQEVRRRFQAVGACSPPAEVGEMRERRGEVVFLVLSRAWRKAEGH